LALFIRVSSVFNLWLKDLCPPRSSIASAETIYRAITSEDGIRAWWTTDVKMDANHNVVASPSPAILISTQRRKDAKTQSSRDFSLRLRVFASLR
jgi:hypothetical protein